MEGYGVRQQTQKLEFVTTVKTYAQEMTGTFLLVGKKELYIDIAIVGDTVS